jgi:hypothetical protein
MSFLFGITTCYLFTLNELYKETGRKIIGTFKKKQSMAKQLQLKK